MSDIFYIFAFDFQVENGAAKIRKNFDIETYKS
jgi:hypothetical protein